VARRVFFSFHYDRDIWRVNQVRQSWRNRPGNDTQPFLDHAAWEAIRRQSDQAVERWIDKQLDGSSVTCVLIGAETASRQFVEYEIRRSVERGNGLLGIRIHQLKDQLGRVDWPGSDPLDRVRTPTIWSLLSGPTYRTYNWASDGGFQNMGRWVEEAAAAVGR
jgi:hypothetical protein